MRLGYTGNNYPERRNIIGLVSNVEYKNISHNNFFAYLNRINFWMTQKGYPKLFPSDYYQYQSIRNPKVDGMHFFNSVSYSNSPWIATFETVLPYFDKMKSGFKDPATLQLLTVNPSIHKALDAMAKPSCKALIALSQSTRNIQEKVLEYFPEYKRLIKGKLMVLHPPQAARPYQPRDWNGKLQLLFVGRAFYRKGGQEMVHALDNLRKKYHVHLTIVSSLDVESGWPGITDAQLSEDMQWLSSQDWITWHPQLPNDQVLDLMQKSHLGLLPTWQDTYGYSVLEMQANGCPVLSTSIRSLPEINPLDCGWRINHETNEWGEWMDVPKERSSVMSEWLSNALENELEKILSSPKDMEHRGRESVERIKTFHHPHDHAARLAEIYQHCFMDSDRH